MTIHKPEQPERFESTTQRDVGEMRHAPYEEQQSLKAMMAEILSPNQKLQIARNVGESGSYQSTLYTPVYVVPRVVTDGSQPAPIKEAGGQLPRAITPPTDSSVPVRRTSSTDSTGPSQEAPIVAPTLGVQISTATTSGALSGMKLYVVRPAENGSPGTFVPATFQTDITPSFAPKKHDCPIAEFIHRVRDRHNEEKDNPTPAPTKTEQSPVQTTVANTVRSTLEGGGQQAKPPVGGPADVTPIVFHAPGKTVEPNLNPSENGTVPIVRTTGPQGERGVSGPSEPAPTKSPQSGTAGDTALSVASAGISRIPVASSIPRVLSVADPNITKPVGEVKGPDGRVVIAAPGKTEAPSPAAGPLGLTAKTALEDDKKHPKTDTNGTNPNGSDANGGPLAGALRLAESGARGPASAGPSETVKAPDKIAAGGTLPRSVAADSINGGMRAAQELVANGNGSPTDTHPKPVDTQLPKAVDTQLPKAIGEARASAEASPTGKVIAPSTTITVAPGETEREYPRLPVVVKEIEGPTRVQRVNDNAGDNTGTTTTRSVAPVTELPKETRTTPGAAEARPVTSAPEQRPVESIKTTEPKEVKVPDAGRTTAANGSGATTPDVRTNGGTSIDTRSNVDKNGRVVESRGTEVRADQKEPRTAGGTNSDLRGTTARADQKEVRTTDGRSEQSPRSNPIGTSVDARTEKDVRVEHKDIRGAETSTTSKDARPNGGTSLDSRTDKEIRVEHKDNIRTTEQRADQKDTRGTAKDARTTAGTNIDARTEKDGRVDHKDIRNSDTRGTTGGTNIDARTDKDVRVDHKDTRNSDTRGTGKDGRTSGGTNIDARTDKDGRVDHKDTRNSDTRGTGKDGRTNGGTSIDARTEKDSRVDHKNTQNSDTRGTGKDGRTTGGTNIDSRTDKDGRIDHKDTRNIDTRGTGKDGRSIGGTNVDSHSTDKTGRAVDHKDARGDHKDGRGTDARGDHKHGRGTDARGDHKDGRGSDARGDHKDGRGSDARGDHKDGRGTDARGDHKANKDVRGADARSDHKDHNGRTADVRGDHKDHNGRTADGRSDHKDHNGRTVDGRSDHKDHKDVRGADHKDARDHKNTRGGDQTDNRSTDKDHRGHRDGRADVKGTGNGGTSIDSRSEVRGDHKDSRSHGGNSTNGHGDTKGGARDHKDGRLDSNHRGEHRTDKGSDRGVDHGHKGTQPADASTNNSTETNDDSTKKNQRPTSNNENFTDQSDKSNKPRRAPLEINIGHNPFVFILDKNNKKNRKQEQQEHQDADDPKVVAKARLTQQRTKYIVKAKDTLESIASAQLKDSRFANLILTINRADVHVSYVNGKQEIKLTTGQVLWLPTQAERQVYANAIFSSKRQRAIKPEATTNTPESDQLSSEEHTPESEPQPLQISLEESSMVTEPKPDPNTIAKIRQANTQPAVSLSAIDYHLNLLNKLNQVAENVSTSEWVHHQQQQLNTSGITGGAGAPAGPSEAAHKGPKTQFPKFFDDEGAGMRAAIDRIADSCRVVTFNNRKDGVDFSTSLQMEMNGIWQTIASYEYRQGHGYRYTFFPGTQSRPFPMDLPLMVVSEMAREDFQRNWENYCREFSRQSAETRSKI